MGEEGAQLGQEETPWEAARRNPGAVIWPAGVPRRLWPDREETRP